MKIVYCLPDTYRPGGIERIISIKANYFVNTLNYNVTIITTGQLNKSNYYLFSERIKFIDLAINYDECLTLPLLKRLIVRLKKRVLHKAKLQAFLFNLKADIVISTFTHESSFLPDIKDGSKKVLESHFFRGHKKKYADSFKFPFITRLGYYYKTFAEENFIIKKYDRFIVLTEEDKLLWSPKIKNVEAIPNILPFDNNKQSNLTNKKVISVGRLDAQKGFDRLISIWKEVYKRRPDWTLEIYGDGEDKILLNAMIEKNNLINIVKICPPVKNIMDKYLDASIFVMTSRYEGMPMTMLEAMSVGLPCVSYLFTCGPRDIINNNEDGFCIDEGNELVFTQRLVELMQNEEQRINFGKAAKSNIQRYSRETVMSKWSLLFDQLVTK